MGRRRRNKLRGIAEPVLGREPLFVRLCSAFIENLTLILRAALVTGALFLVHDLSEFYDRVTDDAVEAETAEAESESATTEVTEVDVPVINDGVMHALNCTFTDYRDAHYDECVDEPSSVYPRPEADPDDIGFLAGDSPVMFASLDN